MNARQIGTLISGSSFFFVRLNESVAGSVICVSPTIKLVISPSQLKGEFNRDAQKESANDDHDVSPHLQPEMINGIYASVS